MHYEDATLYTLVGKERFSKEKEILAVIPPRGRTLTKEGSPEKVIELRDASKEINEVLQKLNHSFDIVILVTRLNTRSGLLVQPQPQYGRKAK